MRPLLTGRVFHALVLCLSLLGARAAAQPVQYFQKKVVDPENQSVSLDRWAVSTLAPGGGMYIATVVGAEYSPTMKLKVTRLAADGTILWQTLGSDTPDGSAVSPQYIRLCPDGGVLVLAKTNDEDVQMVERFSPAGVNEWNRGPYFGVGDDGFLVDKDGCTFVSARSFPRAAFQDWVDKFSPAGTLLWRITLQSDYGGVSIVGIRPDGFGGVYALTNVSGQFYGPDDTLVEKNGFCLLHLTNGIPVSIADTPVLDDFHVHGFAYDLQGNMFTIANGAVYQLLKLDPSGATIWSRPLPGSYPTSYRKISVDELGNSLVQGDSYTPDTPHSFVMSLIKTTAAGAPVWSKSYPETSAFLRDWITDPAGNVMALLTLNGTETAPDVAIVKYLPDGSLGWPSLPGGAIKIASADKEEAGTISRDAAGLLYVSGAFHSGASTNGFLAAKYGPPNNAAFLSQNVPATVIAGQSYSVSETFANTGVSPWTSGGSFYLRSVNPTDNSTWGRTRVDLSPSESILPGQAKKFSFTAIAPMTGGAYNFQWRMSQAGSAFGPASTNKVVTVVVRQNAARYISQAVPTTAVKAGSTFTVKVTMENVGTTAWTQTGGFGIAPAQGYQTWGVAKVGMASTDNIARGSNKTFTVTCTAPSTPGSYTMRWRMRRDASAFTGAFGDLTTSKTITVVP